MKFNDRGRVIASDRLYRNMRRSKIMGVCAGLADFFDVDRTLMRIGFVLAAYFFTLPVLFLYFLAGILLPKRPDWSYY